MAEKKAKKSKLSKVLSIIVDVLFVPIVILALICIVIMFTAKSNNKVPSILGKSIVTVESSSMEDKFFVGDVLVIEKVDVDDIKVGDDIAFYAPLNTPYVATVGEEKVSLAIIHRVLRIIYPIDDNGVKHRFFVCAGINGFSMDKAMFEEVAEGQGDYILDTSTNKCKLAQTAAEKEAANYVVRLLDISNPQDPTFSDIENTTTFNMQYVIGDSDTTVEGNYDYVIGRYSHKLSPILGGFINFSSSSTGILVLVIVPTFLLISFVVISMIKEVKRSKEEDSEENIAIQQNMEIIKTANALNEADMAKEQDLHQLSNDEKAKKEVENELNVGTTVSSDINNGTGAPKKIPTIKRKPNPIANTEDQKMVKPRKIPASVANNQNAQGVPKKIPTKKPTVPTNSNVKKIPRNRTQAWKIAIDDKKDGNK